MSNVREVHGIHLDGTGGEQRDPVWMGNVCWQMFFGNQFPARKRPVKIGPGLIGTASMISL